MNVTHSRPQDWAYLSEGGSTIVFSYTGPHHPHFTGRVLRLRKISNTSSLDSASVDREDDTVVAFQNIVAPLLVPSELPELDVVLLDVEWLTTLEILCNGDRPAERLAKDRIDKTRQKGILARDLIGGAGFLAVEIKPKWGFLPNPAHLSLETAVVKMSTCRFCMHARLKAEHGVLTQYCPLDLYSRDEARMRKAIGDLWDGWVRSDGTLNNMKVFVSGKMVRPSEQSYLSLVEFLSAGTDVQETLATAILPLLQTPALRTVSNLQRSLDALDIEGITKLHSMSYPHAKGLGGVMRDPSLEEWRDFAASYHSVYCTFDHSKLCPENFDTYLKAYLLSGTFKDCSIICRMHRSDAVSGEPSVEPDGMFIIDLDLKGVERLDRWALLDRQIVEHCRAMAPSKLCIE